MPQVRSDAVIAHTPDPAKYHNAATDSQLQRLGGATMIPRARSDGTSLGFDANKPTLLVVDPDNAGGGFVLDMSKVTNKTAVGAVAKVGSVHHTESDNIFAAMQALAAAQNDKAVTPAATPPAMHKTAALAAVPPPLATRLFAQTPNTSDAMSNTTVAAPVPVPSSDAAVQSLLQQVVQALKASSEVVTPQSPALVPITQSPTPVPVLADPTIPGLDIPFLASAPTRPSIGVIYELGQTAGALMLKYHAAVEGEGCLVLVYDTRYEDGQQYIPPDRSGLDGDEALAHVHVTAGGKKKSYVVAMVGMSFSLGSLDFTVLVLVPPTAAAAVPASSRRDEDDEE